MGHPDFEHNRTMFTTQQNRRMSNNTEQGITTSSIEDDHEEEHSPPRTTAQEARCRSVSFNPRARIRSISSVETYSIEERDSYWYSKHDLALIQAEMEQTIILMETNHPIDDSTQCFRGLERRTRTALETKQNERNELLEVVARDYYMQKQYGHDPSVLAEMYRQRCAQDTESAQLMGIVDADEAYSILLQDIVEVLLDDDADDVDDEDDYSNCRWNESLFSIEYESEDDDDPTDDNDASSAASLTKDDLIKESHHRQQRRLSCPPRVLQGSFERAVAA